MSQFLRPSGDVGQSGDWEAEPDDDILYDKIDEAIANDADYAWHNAIAATEYMEVALSDPGGGTPTTTVQAIRWRLDRIGGAKTTNMKCELREGAVIKHSQEVELTDALQALNFPFYTYAVVQTTSWKSPGTCVGVERTGSVTDWADENNAKIQNDTYASVSAPGLGYTYYLRCTNFGFSTNDVPLSLKNFK